MAAHTFELSPHWTRPRPSVRLETVERVPEIEDAGGDTPPAESPGRFAVYWIMISVAVVLVGLTALFAPYTGHAAAILGAPHHAAVAARALPQT